MTDKPNWEETHGRRPRRRKSKDNPYTLFRRDDRYYVSFASSTGNHEVELTEALYLLFDEFELEDKKQANEQERHAEGSEQYEASLFLRSTHSTEESMEDRVLAKLEKAALRKALRTLPPIQMRRVILHYYGGLTYDEIAASEGCTPMPVKRSIDRALEKKKKILE